jgi:hypothetical protein
MHAKNARSTRRMPIARRAGATCLVCLLAACSSGKGPSNKTTSSKATEPSTSSTSTTLPKAAAVAAVRAYFKGDGKALLQYLRAAPLVITGTVPKNADCLRLTREVLPKIANDSNVLRKLANGIPDKRLAEGFSYNLGLELLVIQGCATNALRNQPPITGAAAEKQYAGVRDYYDGLIKLLAVYGVTL